MGIEVEVVLVWMSDVLLYQHTGDRILISISSLTIIILGEDSDMMTLGAYHDGELGLLRG